VRVLTIRDTYSLQDMTIVVYNSGAVDVRHGATVMLRIASGELRNVARLFPLAKFIVPVAVALVSMSGEEVDRVAHEAEEQIATWLTARER